jgi:uroporphyrinogen decarboxylase
MVGPDERWYARGGWITYFEQLQQLRGMENFLADLASEPPGLERLLDDLLAFNLSWIDQWTALGYDGLHFGDDWGGQTSLLVKPALWRKLFKPRYAEMFRRVKAAGMDVWFHSDGFINDIAGDLIEIGVDVLNFQVAVTGHRWAMGNIRGRVAVRTDIDRQSVLPFGSPAQVTEEVQRTFEMCGAASGGLIACGEVGPDVPLANVRAMYEAFRRYGAYGRGG